MLSGAIPQAIFGLYHQTRMNYALGFPQLLQKLPVFVAPHVHVHGPAATGFALPQLLQKLPVFVAPHPHIHEAGAPCAGAPCAGTL